MGMFIEVRIDPEACRVSTGCDLCARLCPVEAVCIAEGKVTTIYDNEDECTLCHLCVHQCPGQAIQVVELYRA